MGQLILNCLPPLLKDICWLCICISCYNFFFPVVTEMQRRIFTIYQTDAPIQTALAMKKLKMSQEFSSVQLMCLVCVFSREFVSFSCKERLLTILMPSMKQEIFAPTTEVYNIGSSIPVHCYYICLLLYIHFELFRQSRHDCQWRQWMCIEQYPVIWEVSKAFGKWTCFCAGLGIISSVFIGVLQNNRHFYLLWAWWIEGLRNSSRVYLSHETFWKLRFSSARGTTLKSDCVR